MRLLEDGEEGGREGLEGQLMGAVAGFPGIAAARLVQAGRRHNVAAGATDVEPGRQPVGVVAIGQPLAGIEEVLAAATGEGGDRLAVGPAQQVGAGVALFVGVGVEGEQIGLAAVDADVGDEEERLMGFSVDRSPGAAPPLLDLRFVPGGFVAPAYSRTLAGLGTLVMRVKLMRPPVAGEMVTVGCAAFVVLAGAADTLTGLVVEGNMDREDRPALALRIEKSSGQQLGIGVEDGRVHGSPPIWWQAKGLWGNSARISAMAALCRRPAPK